jgi:hypothetical protein
VADDNKDVDFSESDVAAWRADIRLRALAHLVPAPAWPPRRWSTGAILLLLLPHLGVLIDLEVKRATPEPEQTTIEIRLIPDPPKEPPLPEPPPLNSLHATADRPHAKPAPPHLLPAPANMVIAPSELATEMRLFNPDGTVYLPAQKPQAPTPEQRAAELRQRGHNMIHCRQTRFAQDFALDESLGDRIARKYLVWIGIADMQGIEDRNARRKAEVAAACDG